MKFLFLTIIFLTVFELPVFAQAAESKFALDEGWKGIRVFKTARSEVEKLLGKPFKEENGTFWYDTDDARLSFIYSGNPCYAPETLMGRFNVKAETVLQYDVRFSKVITTRDLGMDLASYKRFEDRHNLGRANWSYKGKTDIFVETLALSDPGKDIVRTIYFGRTPEQIAKFECQKLKSD
jgi:hypothetical protein